MRWRHKHVEILIRCGHSDHYISASLVPSGKLFFSKIVTFFSDTVFFELIRFSTTTTTLYSSINDDDEKCFELKTLYFFP